MIQPPNAVTADLVLLGGGHAHVGVLKSFAMRPLPGVRITLVSKDVLTPYSGMLPGLIAGHYSPDEAHIDLRPLCNFAAAQFYRGTATGIDLESRRLICTDRPPIKFDVLSINIGSTPRAMGIPGAREYALAVKPIDRFLAGWQELTARVLKAESHFSKICVVGGGAGGVELALCAQFRLAQLINESGSRAPAPQFEIVTASGTALPTHNRRVQEKFERILEERGIAVRTSATVTEVKSNQLLIDGREPVGFDHLLWVVNASAPPWLAESGLGTDGEGFLAVNECLQSVSHPFVFGAGDVASVQMYPRPKSGVFAVRQGAPLGRNLRRVLSSAPLIPFKPQKEFLSLISTGNPYAVASRGRWALEGRHIWHIKQWIDRTWMRQYQELPSPAPPLAQSGNDPSRATIPPSMRCGGCGAKVGSDVLTRVLQRLAPTTRDDVVVGLETPDDAAVIQPPAGMAVVQTVDFFRSLVSDPFLFGRIAANHCLNDIHAMGAEPHSALAIMTVPFAGESQMEEQVFQVLSGALAVLKENHAILIGGHTGEGAELAFGLSVTGFSVPEKLLRKSGMRQGDKLILTKAVGTGTLFAADALRKAKGRWIDRAIESMLASNRNAAQCFLRNGATACTDVTGFGLLGHLVEMAKASGNCVSLRLSHVPILEGAMECIRAGIVSSLQSENGRQKRAVANLEEASRLEGYPLLFDPQTAGGLLASVPASAAEACLTDLRNGGYGGATIIGEVCESTKMPELITVL